MSSGGKGKCIVHSSTILRYELSYILWINWVHMAKVALVSKLEVNYTTIYEDQSLNLKKNQII